MNRQRHPSAAANIESDTIRTGLFKLSAKISGQGSSRDWKNVAGFVVATTVKVSVLLMAMFVA